MPRLLQVTVFQYSVIVKCSDLKFIDLKCCWCRMPLHQNAIALECHCIRMTLHYNAFASMSCDFKMLGLYNARHLVKKQSSLFIIFGIIYTNISLQQQILYNKFNRKITPKNILQDWVQGESTVDLQLVVGSEMSLTRETDMPLQQRKR